MNLSPIKQADKQIRKERREKADRILAKKCESHCRNRDPNDTGIHPFGQKVLDLPTSVATTLCRQVGTETYRSKDFIRYFHRRYPDLKPPSVKQQNKTYFSRRYSANYDDIDWGKV